MLKQILASLALTVGIIHPSIASDIVQFPTRLVCADYETIKKNIEKFKEIPFVTMESYREIGNTVVATTTVMFVNPKTKTYTLVEELNEDLYCIISLGENFKPYKE